MTVAQDILNLKICGRRKRIALKIINNVPKIEQVFTTPWSSIFSRLVAWNKRAGTKAHTIIACVYYLHAQNIGSCTPDNCKREINDYRVLYKTCSRGKPQNLF